MRPSVGGASGPGAAAAAAAVATGAARGAVCCNAAIMICCVAPASRWVAGSLRQGGATGGRLGAQQQGCGDPCAMKSIQKHIEMAGTSAAARTLPIRGGEQPLAQILAFRRAPVTLSRSQSVVGCAVPWIVHFGFPKAASGASRPMQDWLQSGEATHSSQHCQRLQRVIGRSEGRAASTPRALVRCRRRGCAAAVPACSAELGAWVAASSGPMHGLCLQAAPAAAAAATRSPFPAALLLSSFASFHALQAPYHRSQLAAAKSAGSHRQAGAAHSGRRQPWASGNETTTTRGRPSTAPTPR